MVVPERPGGGMPRYGKRTLLEWGAGEIFEFLENPRASEDSPVPERRAGVEALVRAAVGGVDWGDGEPHRRR